MMKRVETGKENSDTTVSFRCNICGTFCEIGRGEIAREVSSCKQCGSTVRWRSVIDVLSTELFGQSLSLTDFPVRPEIRGIGMTDWEGYARGLAQKFQYQNTYYHTEPRLDITCPPESMDGTLDFIITSDVFEHIPPPISVAFTNLRRLLKPGGVVIFTVPWGSHGQTVEHFPNLYDWRVEQRDGVYTLVNRRRDGGVEEFQNLVFHGGPGTTLEMRRFSETSLLEEFARAGFGDVSVYREPCPQFGIYWNGIWSLPMSARAREGR